MREAYRSLGFSRATFRGAFPTTDMDGTWVSADVRIAANKEKIASFLESGEPLLNYTINPETDTGPLFDLLVKNGVRFSAVEPQSPNIIGQLLFSSFPILLLIGAVIGAQFGSKYSVRLKGEQLRILLALMVLGVCAKIGYDLIVTPEDLYSIAPLIAH